MSGFDGKGELLLLDRHVPWEDQHLGDSLKHQDGAVGGDKKLKLTRRQARWLRPRIPAPRRLRQED